MKCFNYLSLFLVLGFSLSLSAGAQNPVQKYFTAEELPDLILCLPAPPDTLSDAFVQDIMRYMWGKSQRQDEERAAMAIRDAVWRYDALLSEFSESFGLEITREGTPEIWKLLENSLATIDQMRVAPKAYYHRKRPFERFNEPMLTGEEESLRGNGSYPSGHTLRGWTAALILSEINPSAANDIFVRAWKYGESRVIAGAHWQSDVDASRTAAALGYARLQTSPLFRRQMASAQKEFRRLQGPEYGPAP